MKTTLIQFIALFLLELIILYPISFVQALSITNVNVTDLGSSSAEIKWSTDEVADGTVRYGLDSNLGSSSGHSTFIFEHTAQLQSLASDKTYFFEVESANINGDTVVDSNNGQLYSFTTNDIIPPDKVVGLQVSRTTKNSITLAWQSSNASDLSRYNIYRNRIKIATSTEATHTDSGLVPGSSHVYKVTAVDTSGNEGPESNTVLAFARDVDLSSKVITNIDLENIQDTSLTITWDTIDDSTSIVYYGLDQSLNNKEEVSTLTKNHSVTLRNLQTGSFYSFIVSSCDANNNCVNSSLSGFDAGRDINAPKINVSMPKFINKRQIDIIGTTEPFSSIKLFVNDLNFPIRALDRTETPTGKFQFLNIQLQKENVIKIEAIDKSNNKVEETFRVSVDTEDPVVVIDQIPSITSSNNLTIVGTVDEPVDINFFLKLGTLSKPNKVAGLKATAGNNSVALEWNESKDEEFSHYVVYREDIGPIAITKPSSYTTFTDLLVNKNEQLTYSVNAVNKFGKESEKSASVTVTVRDGTTGIPPPEPIDTIFVEKPVLSINASGSFSESLKLSRDGSYTLTIEVIDRAKNRVVIEKTILLDTKKPDIKITSPPNNQLIFENYANEVDITGETEPNARVHLFIERTPLGFLEKSGDVAGLPNKIEHISETELDAKCRLELGGQQFCSTAADFSTTADSNGNFKFENVDATSILSGGIRVEQIPGTQLREERRFEEEKVSRLVFIATDQAGLRNAKEHKLRIGTCWSGNQSWDIIPLTRFQSPGLLSPLRLSENKEFIQFWFNYTYIGRGEEARVNEPNGVSIEKACSGTEVLGDKRFNISCQIMPGSGTTIVNPEGTISVTTLKLNRIEGMERFLHTDWKDFFDSLSNELTFPFKIRIRYKHTVDGQEIQEVQTTCQEVTYVLDNSLIDPRSVLPDWLLYDAVDILQELIKTLNEVDEVVKRVVDFVTVGCVSSFLLRIVLQSYRRFISFGEEKLFQLSSIAERIIPGPDNYVRFSSAKEEDQKYCNEVANNIMRDYNLKGREGKEGSIGNKFFGLKLEYFSDSDLKRCFPNVASAWDTEAFWYRNYRFTCDRIFGHETPSGWTENLEDEKIVQVLEEGQVCGVDESVRGVPLRPYKCKDIASEFNDNSEYSLDDICFRANTVDGRELWKLVSANPVSGTDDLYEISAVVTPSRRVETSYAIKQTETQYLKAQPDTCAQICGTEQGHSGYGDTVTEPPKGWLSKDYNPPQNQNDEARVACITANECRTLPQITPKELEIKGKAPTEAFTKGFTADCFYDARKKYTYAPIGLENVESISNNPEQRYECCCINVEDKAPSIYYHYNDLNLYKTPEEDTKPEPTLDGRKFAHESKEGEGIKPESFDDMEWSYRYWKEGYRSSPTKGEERRIIHSKYNPNRYTEGRDQPACFGQDSWFYDFNKPVEGEAGNLLIMDSRNQLLSTLQCANLGGIHNRIIEFNNFQSALASCLIDVRESGTSDSAACKEIFTRFVCSSIWDAVNLFTNSCSPFSIGKVIDDEDDYFGNVRDGFASVTQSITDAQGEIAAEYGNVELNNLLGTGAGEIARKVCLGFFGYDWDLNLQNVVDAAYSQSFDTLVQATTGTREFLAVDPAIGGSTFEYRASWIINPGCDLENYNIDLVCVTRDEAIENNDIRCDSVNSPDGNNCDCLDAEDLNEGLRTQRFFSHRGKIQQNEFIQGSESKIESSLYRYDHLKFKLITDRKLAGNLQRTCFPSGHEDGVFYFPLRDKTPRDIIGCALEPLSGVFVCEGGLDIFSAQGFAQIVSVKVNDQTPRNNEINIFEGQALKISPSVFKSPDSPVKCLEIELDKNFRNEIDTRVIPIDLDRTKSYAVTLEKNVQLAKAEIREPDITPVCTRQMTQEKCNEIEDTKLVLEPIVEDNKDPISVTLKFIDVEPDRKIDLTVNSNDIIIIEGGKGEELGDLYEKGFPVISIRDGRVKYLLKSIDRLPDDIEEIEYKLRVFEQGVDEHWDLTLSLYESFEDDPDCGNYNKGQLIKYNGVEQQREIKLIVNQKGIAAGRPIIKITPESVNEDKYLSPNNPVNLNIEVSDDSGLVDVSYSIVVPEAGIFPIDEHVENNCKVESGTDKISCQLQISTELLSDTLKLDKIAGEYSIIVKAEDNDGNPNKEEYEFQVTCGPSSPNSFGICRIKDDTCTTIDVEAGGFNCDPESKLKCCELFSEKKLELPGI